MVAMPPTVLHLRSETKALERRSALTPSTTKALLEGGGYIVNVERSHERIFDDEEFEAVGATLVSEGSWVNAPKEHIIVGLKELPADRFPLHHAHVQFGHCYKKQANWASYLSRFARGGGTLYDIEFLTDPSGRRVAAFGYYAGYAGAAIALLAWAYQLEKPDTPLPSVPKYPSESAVVDAVKTALSSAISNNHAEQPPRVLIIGALGRCGSGAVDLCAAVGIPSSSVLKWDMAETARGGPFPEIAAADVFINCVFLAGTPTPPFVTFESLARSGRQLRVACDVSCDPTDPHNPVPIYDVITTFSNPTVEVKVDGDGPPLTMVSIDHLPSLVAREASNAFSELLLPSLKTLDRRNEEDVWVRAEKLFRDKVAELPVVNK